MKSGREGATRRSREGLRAKLLGWTRSRLTGGAQIERLKETRLSPPRNRR